MGCYGRKAEPSPAWLVSTSLLGMRLRVDVFRNARRRGHRQAVGLEALDVKADGVADLPFHHRDAVAGRDASGEVGDVSGVISPRLLDDDCVTHHDSFSPACFTM